MADIYPLIDIYHMYVVRYMSAKHLTMRVGIRIYVIVLCFADICPKFVRCLSRQGRAEDFQIGVTLIYLAREACENFASATPNFWLLGVALRMRCGAK